MNQAQRSMKFRGRANLLLLRLCGVDMILTSVTVINCDFVFECSTKHVKTKHYINFENGIKIIN